MIAAGVSLNDAGINRKAFAFDQAGIHAGAHHGFEHPPQHVAFTEAPVTIDRKRRMIRHLVRKIEAAKPPIGEVKINLLTKSSFRPHAVTVADNQHADHKLRINRWATNVAIERLQRATKIT